MNFDVFDIETDGIDATKIHCLAKMGPKGPVATPSYGNMQDFLESSEVLVGHNIIRFDIPVVKRLLGVEIKAKLVDTLALSWYLEPDRLFHGLEEWGEEFGIPKPQIVDWENLSVEEYMHRCKEDVKINSRLWDRQWKHLLALYGSEEEAWRLIDYLSFKMDCARQQEADRWKLDVEKAKSLIVNLREEYDKRHNALKEVMPRKPIIKVRTKPKKLYLKGKLETLTKAGEAWYDLLSRVGLPEDTEGPVEETVGSEEGNPGSHEQIKAWLYSLGWSPLSFDYKRNKDTNEVRKIPQIKNKLDDTGGLCPSVKELFSKEPSLEILEGMSIISHRLGILEGFIENVDEEGYIKAQIGGFTNTLRFKHRTIVNLPGVDKPYGSDIRGCLIAPEGYELCGSDMSSLEDRTKQHYMYAYDPDYVKEMQTDGYDPHLALAVFAGRLSEQQAEDHKQKKVSYRDVRHLFKTVNYACVYGARPPTVARSAKCSIDDAEVLVDAYWKKNWSVLKIAEECKVRTLRGQKWLYNPVSKLWYSLRYEKDRFSTLNQGTGVYCFDTWVKHIRSKRKQLTGQFHDEIVLCARKEMREKIKGLLLWAIEETNKELNLNVRLDVDVQFGDSYANIH